MLSIFSTILGPRINIHLRDKLIRVARKNKNKIKKSRSHVIRPTHKKNFFSFRENISLGEFFQEKITLPSIKNYSESKKVVKMTIPADS